jgi:AcrR family transcriptional regulator
MAKLSEATVRGRGRARVPAPRMQPAGASDGRREAVAALLDAAERLLVQQGYGAITTRKLAEHAGVNHGLVHYYFGSMEEVMVQVLERFTERLIERQRAMYASDRPFVEKWRAAWAFQDEDLASGYTKIWLELQAVAWNRPEMRARVQQVNEEWRRVLTEALAPALGEYGFGALSLDAAVSLVMTMAQGYALERLSGIEAGHAALLSEIDAWMKSRSRAGKGSRSPQKKERSS